MKKIMRLCQKSGWLSLPNSDHQSSGLHQVRGPARQPDKSFWRGGLRLKAHFEWLRTIMNI